LLSRGNLGNNDLWIRLAGDAYATGYTSSSDLPTSGGAFDTTFNGNVDAFVTKLNPAGSALLAAICERGLEVHARRHLPTSPLAARSSSPARRSAASCG
jgi:hypothetical protein